METRTVDLARLVALIAEEVIDLCDDWMEHAHAVLADEHCLGSI